MKIRQALAILVAVMLLLPTVTGEAWAARKKKDSAEEDATKAAAELQKTLEPIATQLDELMAKMQARALFSPQDAGVLGKIKYQLVDLMYANPKDDQMAKPVYQAAVLYTDREDYNDAYELFSYVSSKYPKTPYAQKSLMKLGELERRLGANYFSSAKTEAPPEKPEKKAEEAKK